jgi:hypothetical protein
MKNETVLLFSTGMAPHDIWDTNATNQWSFYESYCHMLEQELGWWINQIHDESERPVDGFDGDTDDAESEILLDNRISYDSDFDDDQDTIPLLVDDDEHLLVADENLYCEEIIDLTCDSDDETVEEN